MRNVTLRTALTFAAATSGVLARPCICVYEAGSWAAVSDETSLLVWDEKNKTEHLVRAVSFQSKAKDFGFLIPTPTVPEIKDADAAVFDTLGRIEHESYASRNLDSKEAAGAEVLAVQKAAGLIATTLRADSGRALEDWMKSNGYPVTGDVKAWAKPYLDKKWPMTTFKVDPDAGSKDSPTRALRMSFKAEQPFYPYRGYQVDSSTDKAPERRLKLYVLSRVAMEGVFGAGDWSPRHRDAIPERLSEKDRAEIERLSSLPAGSLAGLTTLTVFDDSVPASKRTSDLTFRHDRASEAGRTMAGVLTVGGFFGGGLVLLTLSRRRRRLSLVPVTGI
ncbi:MAG: DUF2330 domain-containing protein [Armatimonadetes bacterium]|nr:DUF2330 domain-containing protein [Armatimonadota bacterium]